MRKFNVETEGRNMRPVVLKTVYDVDSYVIQVRAKGTRQVLVGEDGEEPRPYDEWRATRSEPPVMIVP